MSISRCGLQVSRNPTITNDTHDQPRSKQIGCMIQGTIIQKPESFLSQDVVTDELEDQIEKAKEDKQMKGEGFRSFLTTLSKIPLLREASESLAAQISNAFPDSDENARPIFPGELHAVLKLPNEKFGRANYMGPGTHVLDRLRRGDPPRVLSDKVSQAHDIRYQLSKTEDDVRVADEKMLRKLNQLKREGTDRSINITPAQIGIRGKIIAEDFGLLSRSRFVNLDKEIPPEGKALLQSKLAQLEQEGFGKGAPPSKDKLIFTRNQVRQISAPAPKFVRHVPLAKPNPLIAPGPGPSATQQLVDVYTSPSQRGIPQVDRKQSRTIGQWLTRFDNTKGVFANRSFHSDSLTGGRIQQKRGQEGLLEKVNKNQKGQGQDPAPQPTPASEKINIQRQKPQKGKGHPKQKKGGAWPGVNPINVQAGSGAHRDPGDILTDPPAVFPGTRLVKKIQKKIKKTKPAFIKGKGRHAVFMNDHNMAGFLADKIVPLIMAR